MYFAIRNKVSQYLIDVDSDSGGYPHDVTNPTNATFWNNIKQALEYLRVINWGVAKYELVEIELIIHTISQDQLARIEK